MHTEWVHDPSRFLELGRGWNALRGSRGEASVFYRHEWFEAVWAWRSQDSTLALLCVWEGTEITGVLPLVRTTAASRSGRRERLEFLSVPDTQWCDLLVAPGCEVSAAKAVAAALIAASDLWDDLILAYLPEESNTACHLVPALDHVGIAASVDEVTRNLVIDLGKPWSTYLASRTRSHKKALNLSSNRMERAGPSEIGWFRGYPPGGWDAGPLLATLVAVSGQSWKGGVGASLDQPGPKAFIKRLSELSAREGWLSVWTLTHAARPVATEYQLIFGTEVHALRSDFDLGFEALSPGTYLNRKLLETLFESGCTRYLMGPGENAYKLRWADAGEAVFQMRAYSPTWKGRLASVCDRLMIPAARCLRDTFQPAMPRGVAAES